MSVKVGLETSSAVAAPRPSTMPLASVVLPAPRLPISSTAPESSGASSRPRAMVSSSVRVRQVRDFMLCNIVDRLAEVTEQVGSQHGCLAQFRACNFAREAMQIDGGGNGKVGLFLMLRD